MPSVRFEYLQAGVRYVNPDGTFSQAFRVYWQQLLDAEDAALDTLETAVTNINDVLDRMTDVELLADGTFAIVDQGMESDGTVKTGKVITDSVAAEAITNPVFYPGSDTMIPDSGSEVTIMTTSTQTVGDAIYGGALITMQFIFSNQIDGDAGAEIYLETQSNGGSWVRHTDATIKVGARTTGGDTFAFIPSTSNYPVADAALATLAARMIGKSVLMPSAGSLWDSDILKPSMILTPLKR